MEISAEPAVTALDPKAGKRANYEAYRASAAAGELTVSHRPIQLYLEITSRCNLRCQKCGFAWDPSLAKNGKDIAWPLLARMDDYFAAATEVYTFGYGEMFLYPELAPLVTVLKNHHCRVSGVTNGVLIRPADVVWLVATGYDHLAFSIDGATEETMQNLRGASLAKVLNALRMIHAEKQRRKSSLPNIVVNFVAQADNFAELPDLVRQLAPLGIYFLGVNPLHHFSGTVGGYHGYYEKYRLGHVPRAEFDAAVEEAREQALAAGMLFESFVNPDFEWSDQRPGEAQVALHVHAAAEVPAETIESASLPAEAPAGPVPTSMLPVLPEAPPAAPAPGELSPMYCHYPWTTLYLSPTGTAKVCCYMSVGEGLGSFTGEAGIEEVWNGPSLQAVRASIREGRVHPACGGCVKHRSFENHAAAMHPIEAELRPPPAPPVPVAAEPQPVEAAPAEPLPGGLRRVLRRLRKLGRGGDGSSASAA